MNDTNFGKFDTLLCINVIEHVWDAYEVLSNMYDALKPGGILIYHDRFYPFPQYGEKVLKQFETIYLFEGQTEEQIKRQAGEVGFYFIGKKK